jgi:hypothetical protein
MKKDKPADPPVWLQEGYPIADAVERLASVVHRGHGGAPGEDCGAWASHRDEAAEILGVVGSGTGTMHALRESIRRHQARCPEIQKILVERYLPTIETA